MFVIGLTGGIGSGKTTVANLFKDKGITIIDTDQLSRQLTEPNQPAYQAIIQAFGSSLFSPDLTLNRAMLRKIIFTHPEKRLWLEHCLHPLILKEAKRLAEQATSPYCIVVIPLLFETKPHTFIDRILVIDATEEQQLARALQRDQSTKTDIQAIMQTQLSRKERTEKADDIILNDGNIAQLATKVENLHQIYLKIAAHHAN